MSMTAIMLIVTGVFLLLLIIGVPVAYSLGISGFIGLTSIVGFDKAFVMLSSLTYRSAASFSYAVIPLFVVMGMLVTHTGMSKDIFDCLGKWTNRIPGGLGVATVWSCTLFGMLNGSAAVTASVFTKAAGPHLLDAGYKPNQTYGMIASAGCIGQFIPPSIVIIIYGNITDDSIGKLLMAAISPGLCMAIVFSAVMIITALLRPDLVPKNLNRFTMWTRIKELRKLISVFIVGAILIVGLSSGMWSTTESGAIGALVFIVYALVKKVKIKYILEAFKDAAGTSCMMFIVMGCGSVFAKFVTITGLGDIITSFVNSVHLTPSIFMIVAFVIYLILGCFLDPTSILIITLPLFMPVVNMLGIDHIQFAMVVILALHVGGITPPVGLTAFFTKAAAGDNVTLQGVFKGALPYLFSFVALTILFIFVPTLSTWIPNMLFN